MRVLLSTSIGRLGHLIPILRAARAVEAAGAEALVLVPPALRDAIAASGFRYEVGAPGQTRRR